MCPWHQALQCHKPSLPGPVVLAQLPVVTHSNVSQPLQCWLASLRALLKAHSQQLPFCQYALGWHQPLLLTPVIVSGEKDQNKYLQCTCKKKRAVFPFLSLISSVPQLLVLLYLFMILCLTWTAFHAQKSLLLCLWLFVLGWLMITKKGKKNMEDTPDESNSKHTKIG